MKEEINEIIKKLDDIEEIKRLKQLQSIINNNQTYLRLMNEFTSNRQKYIENNSLNDELLSLRKKLFSIPELSEYLKLQNDVRLLSININKIMLSILD